MSKYYCPYCGAELVDSAGIFYCEKHKINYDFQKMTTGIHTDAPKSVQDSITLLSDIVAGDVWIAYGPFDLFDDNFSLENTVCLSLGDAVDTNKMPKVGDVFIAHNKYASRYLKPTLIMSLLMCDSNSLTGLISSEVVSVDSALLEEFTYGTIDMTLTSEQSRALTAFIADSAVATAAVLLNQSQYSIEGMSNSNVLMSYLFGNKASVCENFSSQYLLERLKELIYEQGNFCTKDNLDNCRQRIEFNNYVKHLSLIQAQGLFATDYSPERELLPGNEYLFWRNNIIQNVSQLIMTCTNDTMLHAASDVSDVYRAAYKVWGCKYTLNKKLLQRAKELVGESDKSLLYITYWNLLIEKMESKLGK